MNSLMKLIFAVILSAVFLVAFVANAQFDSGWPQKPRVGKVFLADTTRDLEVTGVTEALDGSLRILVRYPIGGNYGYELHAMGRDGSILWPQDRESRKIGTGFYYGYDPLPNEMYCGEDGRTWVFYDDEYYGATSAPETFSYSYIYGEFYAQIVDSDGRSQYDGSVSVTDNIGYWNQPRGTAWDEEYGALVFWERSQYLEGWPDPVKQLESRQLWVNSISSDGALPWSSPKLLCDSLTTGVGGVARDGKGGAFIVVGSAPWHVDTEGNLTEQPPIAAFDKQFREVHTLEVEPNRMLVVAYDSEDVRFYLALISSDGTAIHSSSFHPDIPVRYFISDPFPAGNGRFGFTYNTRDYGDILVQVTAELNLAGQSVLDEYDGVWHVDRGWFGMVLGHSGDSPEDAKHYSWVTRQNLKGMTVWSIPLTMPGLYNVHPYPFVASDGTTYIFWSLPGIGTDRTYPKQRDIYVNVIDLDGNWGSRQVTGVDEVAGGLPTSFNVGIYPNPTNSSWQVTVETPTNATVTLELYNLLGRKMLETHVLPSAGRARTHFDGVGLASGVYLVRVVDGRGCAITRRITLLK